MGAALPPPSSSGGGSASGGNSLPRLVTLSEAKGLRFFASLRMTGRATVGRGPSPDREGLCLKVTAGAAAPPLPPEAAPPLAETPSPASSP